MVYICFSFGGVFMVCWTDPNRKPASVNLGELFSILGAILSVKRFTFLFLFYQSGGDKNRWKNENESGNVRQKLFLEYKKMILDLPTLSISLPPVVRYHFCCKSSVPSNGCFWGEQPRMHKNLLTTDTQNLDPQPT